VVERVGAVGRVVGLVTDIYWFWNLVVGRDVVKRVVVFDVKFGEWDGEYKAEYRFVVLVVVDLCVVVIGRTVEMGRVLALLTVIGLVVVDCCW